jgi:gamma-glutamylputrescine oxidase
VSASDPATYVPSWYTATAVPAPARPPLASDLDIDVCVIGAGLAGLTAAREIARLGWSVAVVETHRIAWSASGRNCGFVLPGYSPDIDEIIERVGLEHARELWALSEAGMEYVRTSIREADMPGVDPIDGWLNVSKVDDGGRFIEIMQLLGQELGVVVEGWPTERVRDVLRTSSYFHAMHFPRAFHIHPLNYALGLAAAAEAAGAQIFERTPALAIDPHGVRKRVDTPRGRIRAGQVVLAGNVHMRQLMPRAAGTLLPIWTYVATSAPLGPRLAEAIAYFGAVSDGHGADNHYRIVDGDRLMVSGRATTWEANPKWFAGGLKADIAALYPKLEGMEFDYLWSGVLGRTLHGMPQIGELSPGIWLASGFGGHGFNTTAMAGNLIARAIVEGDDTWRLFLPYELIWAGGRPGRVAAQIGYWWRRTRQGMAARASRRREAQSRRQWQAEEPGEEPVLATTRSEPPVYIEREHARASETVAMAEPAVDFPAEPALEEERPVADRRKRSARLL